MYEKIVIIGQAGAGKSTLARKLGALFNMKVYHLDRRFWHSKWKAKSRETRREIMERLAHKKRWIIEGSYLNASDIHLNEADTIIFLDMPVYLCFWRVIMRYLRYKKEPRPDLPEGCPERLSPRYILKVLAFPYLGRRQLLEKLEEIEVCEASEPRHLKKTVHIFKSREAVDAFLQELATRLQNVHEAVFA